MHKYFLNHIIRKIWKDDFNSNTYEMAKTLGHVNTAGKVQNQKIDNWLKDRSSIRPENFIELLEKLGYSFELEEFEDIIKK